MISEKKFLEQILKLADLRQKNNFSDYARDMLLRIIRCADGLVKKCFFSNAKPVNLPYIRMCKYTELAVRYVSYIISGSNRQEFASKIKTASYEDIGRWFELYARDVGEDILTHLIDERFELPSDTIRRKTFFNKVADMLCEDYFEGMTKLVSATKSPAPAQLVLAVLRSCSFEAYGRVRRAWASSDFFSKTFPDYKLLLFLDEFPGLDVYKSADILSKALEADIYQTMANRGKQVGDWLSAQTGPVRFGLLVNMSDKNTVLKTMVPHVSMRLRENANDAVSGAVNSLAVQNKRLFINNRPVACHNEGNKYVWQDNATKGCVWFYHHGLAAEGYVYENGEKKLFSASSEDVNYRITYRSDAKTKAFEVRLGTRMNEKTGGYLLYGALYYKGNKIMESYPCRDNVHIDDGASDNGFLKADYSKGLNLKIELGDALWSVFGEDMVHEFTDAEFDLWSAELALSNDFHEAKGMVWEQTTTDTTTGKGREYAASGTCVLPDAAVMLSGMTENITSNELAAEEQMKQLEKLSVTNADGPKSITELFTLPAPNMKDANTLASDTLYNLMVYYVSDMKFDCKGTKIEWNRWFGRNKDKAREAIKNVDIRILELVEGNTANKDVQDFLVRYAKGALANAYSGSSEADIEDALASAKKRLENNCTLPDLCSFYLQGDGKTSLSLDKGYNIAIEVINRYAYAVSTSGLSKYIDDADGDWARKLYDQCLASLPQLKLEVISGGSSEVSHKTMMLNILDDTKYDGLVEDVEGKSVPMTYGAAIYMRVFNMQLTQMANALGISFTGDPNHPDFVKMMREIYNVMWVELQKDTSEYFSDEILKAFKKEREKFQDLTQEEYIQECIDITVSGMKMIQAGATIVSIIPKLSKLSKRPSGIYTGLTCSIIFYAISIGSLASVFMKWNKSTVEEKVEAILTCVKSVCQIGMAIVKIDSMRILLNPDSEPADCMNAALRLNMDKDMSTLNSLSKASGKDINDCSNSCAKELSASLEEKGFEGVASNFTKFFRIAEYALRSLTVVLMGLATVMSAVELAKAVAEGGYTAAIYLEIISTSFMGLTCVLEGVAFVLDIVDVTCSCIPVIGAVCCLVGLVLEVIAMAINKPVNPTIAFIVDEINPFLDTLEIPTAEWIEDHTKKNDRLAAAFA